MPELYLMRHAKSAWDQPGLKDHDRKLTEQGIERTRKIIQFLKLQQISFDLIISSTAVRAKSTAQIIAEGLGYDKSKIQIEKCLYESDTDSYYDVLELIPDEIKAVLIVAHNPTVSEMVAQMSNLFANQYMPTSGMAALQLNSPDWAEIKKTEAILKFIIFPKMLS